MNIIESLRNRLHFHMPLLIAVTAMVWAVLACGWSLCALAHPLR